MNFKQKLSILFYLVRSKRSKDGKIPIYVRITIDGLDDYFSSGCKVLDEDWDGEKKQVLPTDKSYKQTNKTLGQIKTDLERHFDLLQAKDGFATTVLVIESYKTPINGAKIRDEKTQNLAFSDALDTLILKYLKFSDKRKKAYEFDQTPPPERKILLDEEESILKKELTKVVKQGNDIFDKKATKRH
ncbi:Arm DNA-binding domain-containing protein [Chitinophaga sancti]|uniref:Arm DNA-binding domain-containing protein n=1 Tax=Chitinophaga sancti TaxID=1004 RepID=UPI002A758200|nr:Arm DNA-binding domain-containing protein [Chitinophaga sancti]WPQ62026.1 Arm DNA-binding domain-containing protein [Chitinophaga sancti]